MNELQTSKEASLKPLDTFKMDPKSTNLIEHVQRNKPADQVSLHYIVSKPLSFNKLSVPKTEVPRFTIFQTKEAIKEIQQWSQYSVECKIE